MAELPKLYIDNPGGDWLQRKLEEAQEDYQTAPLGSSRRNLGGSNVTGYFKTSLDLSPDLLKGLPGALGEEDFRRSGVKLERLEKSIREQGYKPSPILIQVREDGQPFIIEGNHRVAEALKSGRASIPVELKYLRGGEDAEGPLSMDRLREFYGNQLRGQEPPISGVSLADEPRPLDKPTNLLNLYHATPVEGPIDFSIGELGAHFSENPDLSRRAMTLLGHEDYRILETKVDLGNVVTVPEQESCF